MKDINQTNQQILYYARNFLQCRGYNGFSYRDISQKLGIKNAAIHNYYPKKEDLVAALLEDSRKKLAENIAQIVESGGSAREQLQYYFDYALKEFDEGKSICPPGSVILDFKEQCMIREAVLIGPGCGVNQETGLLLEQSLRHAQRVVVDADALTVLADSEDLQAELSARTVRKLEPAILTPHPGEFYRLYPEAKSFPEGRIKAARDLADRWHAVIVLKGAGTIVAIPECIQAERSTWINTTGNHGLARGGSGDVLAGLMTGLLAQQLPLTEAVCGAVYLHGLAGDLMSEAVGARAMDIANLPDYIGMAFRVNDGEEEADYL